MRLSRLISALLVVAVSLPSVGSGEGHRAPVLPEVDRLLEKGEACLRAGRCAEARAHAELVLVGERITCTIVADRSLDDREARDGERAVRRAMDRWEEGLDDALAMEEPRAGEEPTVTIRLQADVVRDGENLAGWVSWNRTMPVAGAPARYRAEILLRTRRTDGRRMSPEALAHEAAHELGHVLGLDDVDVKGALMGPLDPARPCDGPSRAEIDAVAELRHRASRLADAADAADGRGVTMRG